MRSPAAHGIGPAAASGGREGEGRVVLSADPPGQRRPYDDSVRAALRSFLAEPRVPDPPRRTRWDVPLVVIALVAVVVEVALRADMPMRPLSLVAGVVLALTLPWRRTYPFAMTLVVFGTFTVVDIPRYAFGDRPMDVYSSVLVLLVPYALFRWGSGRDATRGFAVMLVPATLATVFDYTGPGDAIGGFLVFLTVLAVAAAVRFRGRARQRELEQVRLGERERLARDLHDTVAHHVSAIAIRAQAGLAVGATNPDAALDSLRVIEGEATRTLAEMRSMVRYLRIDGDVDLAPMPTVADLRGLAADRPGELRVDVELTGPVADVPTAVSSAVYRIAQESVTNARRHARHATRVAVAVVVDASTVRLRVHDDGDAVPAHRVGDGYGVRGMVERATLLGGTCTAGPDLRRGWTVLATIPCEGAS